MTRKHSFYEACFNASITCDCWGKKPFFLIKDLWLLSQWNKIAVLLSYFEKREIPYIIKMRIYWFQLKGNSKKELKELALNNIIFK